MTAELAVGLPALSLVLAAGVGVIATLGAQLRCADAAAIAARMAARGQPIQQIRSVVGEDAPGAARLSLVTAQGLVTATVADRLELPLLGQFSAINLTAHVTEPVEAGS